MRFRDHFNLTGKHAFLSASNYHWINYSDQKLEARYLAHKQAARGTDLHALAHEAIRLNVRLANSDKTIAAYVRDGIAYKMAVEQPLFYSENCFGTPDTMCFRRNKLRIHDYKSGIVKASHHQLEVYAALFCLEYDTSPYDIEIELRIYQNEEVRTYIPHPDDIQKIMNTIIAFDRRLEYLKEELE